MQLSEPFRPDSRNKAGWFPFIVNKVQQLEYSDCNFILTVISILKVHESQSVCVMDAALVRSMHRYMCFWHMNVHSSSKETQLFEIIHSCIPWIRVSDPRSFSTLIMTRGHWPWPRGFGIKYFQKVANHLKKSVTVSRLSRLCTYNLSELVGDMSWQFVICHDISW